MIEQLIFVLACVVIFIKSECTLNGMNSTTPLKFRIMYWLVMALTGTCAYLTVHFDVHIEWFLSILTCVFAGLLLVDRRLCEKGKHCARRTNRNH